MIPRLPVAAVRKAVVDSDWEGAARLLREHHRSVEQALADGLHLTHAGDWERLLQEQETMASELKSARDETYRLLQQLAQQRRGARAYLERARA